MHLHYFSAFIANQCSSKSAVTKSDKMRNVRTVAKSGNLLDIKWSFALISGQVDRASTIETIGSSSIRGRVTIKTRRTGTLTIHR